MLSRIKEFGKLQTPGATLSSQGREGFVAPKDWRITKQLNRPPLTGHRVMDPRCFLQESFLSHRFPNDEGSTKIIRSRKNKGKPKWKNLAHQDVTSCAPPA